ncbi:MAG: pseudouridine synthase [Pirellulales bacterium]
MSLHSPSTAAPADSAPAPDDHLQRLQKILAAAGLGSRRRCEELILQGRVAVDGQTVTELGSKADPCGQEIRVDGVPITQARRVYYLVHKPPGVVSTSHDPSGRPRVIDLVPTGERLFAVGRLDLSSEGLIILTNDGALANRLAHPRYGVQKTYQVEVAGTLERDDVATLRKGVHLAEGFAHVVSVKIKHAYKHSTQLEIVLAEGRNREIRRILARIGHKVLRLKRIAIGPLRLADLPPGAARPLTRHEVRELEAAAGPGTRAPKRRQRPRRVAAKPPTAPRARTIIGEASHASLPSQEKATEKQATGAKPQRPRRPPRKSKPATAAAKTRWRPRTGGKHG